MARPALLLLLSLSVVLAHSAHCGAAGKCSHSQTCCALSSGGVGCCPHKEAECCSDQTSCCPSGFQCAASGGCRQHKNTTVNERNTWRSQRERRERREKREEREEGEREGSEDSMEDLSA
jgi:hypothetical protein